MEHNLCRLNNGEPDGLFILLPAFIATVCTEDERHWGCLLVINVPEDVIYLQIYYTEAAVLTARVFGRW